MANRMLDARLEVDTPEQVVLSLPLGGVGSRIAAYALDLLIRLALSVLIAIPAVFVAANFPGLEALALAAALVGYFLLHFGYYVYYEVLHAGQTPGKRRMGLRTVKLNGEPVDLLTSLLRNVMRVVDWLPALYGLGMASMFVSASEQRLGDLTAGTVVVRERRPDEPQPPVTQDYDEICRELGLLHPERIRPNLDEDEAEALRRLLERMPTVQRQNAQQLLEHMVRRVQQNMSDPEAELAPLLEAPEGRVPALRFVLARHDSERAPDLPDGEARK